jgi:hypothetical protein
VSNSAIQKILVSFLVVISVAACGAAQTTPTPTATPTATPTPTPTATPTATPTPTPTPSPTPTPIPAPTLTGTTESKTGSPVRGIGVILCLVSVTSCTTDKSLMTISDSAGQFEFNTVPAGKYIVMYNQDGAIVDSATNLTVAVDDNTTICLGEAIMGGSPASCQASTPFLRDHPGPKLVDQSVLQAPDGSVFLKDGTIYSSVYHLAFNFQDGAAVTVTVADGTTATTSVVVHRHK